MSSKPQQQSSSLSWFECNRSLWYQEDITLSLVVATAHTAVAGTSRNVTTRSRYFVSCGALWMLCGGNAMATTTTSSNNVHNKSGQCHAALVNWRINFSPYCQVLVVVLHDDTTPPVAVINTFSCKVTLYMDSNWCRTRVMMLSNYCSALVWPGLVSFSLHCHTTMLLHGLDTRNMWQSLTAIDIEDDDECIRCECFLPQRVETSALSLTGSLWRRASLIPCRASPSTLSFDAASSRLKTLLWGSILSVLKEHLYCNVIFARESDCGQHFGSEWVLCSAGLWRIVKGDDCSGNCKQVGFDETLLPA